MTIDELEGLENGVRHFGLRDLMEDYSRACCDRKTSIKNYIAGTEKYGLYHNSYLAAKTLEVIDLVKSQIYGDK